MENIAHAENSENAILSTLLITPNKSIHNVVAKLTPDDFYKPENKIIYEVIISLYEKGIEIDIVTVVEETKKLKGEGIVKERQLTSYSGMLIKEGIVLEPENIDYHIDLIIENSLRRKDESDLKIALAKLEKGEALESVIEFQDKALLDLKEKKLAYRFEPLSIFTSRIVRRDDKRKPEEPLGYHLNKFTNIERAVDGIQSGFYLLGGYTGKGKTLFLVNICLDLIQSNPDLRGIFVSLDDSRSDIVYRFLSLLSELSINDIQRNPTSGEDKLKRLNAIEDLKKLGDENKLEIVSLSEVENTLLYIRTEILKSQGNIFICIDDVHNLQMPDSYATGLEREKELTAGVKELAVIYNIPILTTGKVRKPPSAKTTAKGKESLKPPTEFDLLGTCAFGYRADLLWILHPTNVEKFDDRTSNEIQLYYKKNKLSGFKKKQKLEWIYDTGILKEIKIELR